MQSLEEVESFVIKNKHLPDILSGDQMQEKAMSLAKMRRLLRLKIE